jgi:hypothetical protein
MATDPHELDVGMSPKLKQELELALAGWLETSRELEDACAGDIGAVEHIWRKISEDRANIAEKDVWVSSVARRVVDDVLTVDAQERPRAALTALGFSGVLDLHWRLKYDLEVLDGFKNLTDSSEPSRRKIAQQMQARGHLKEKTVDQAMKVIDRLRESRRERTSTSPPEK